MSGETDEQIKEREERQQRFRGDDIEQKLLLIRDDKKRIEGILLPENTTLENVNQWMERFINRKVQITRAEQFRLLRLEGRTFRENWALPPFEYMRISSNVGGPQGDFPTGVRIVALITGEGRRTITEIQREFGAVDENLLAVAVHQLRTDHYLKTHHENDEEHTLTLEALEVDERNNALALESEERLDQSKLVDIQSSEIEEPQELEQSQDRYTELPSESTNTEDNQQASSDLP